jgi:hypothetical protein
MKRPDSAPPGLPAPDMAAAITMAGVLFHYWSAAAARKRKARQENAS